MNYSARSAGTSRRNKTAGFPYSFQLETKSRFLKEFFEYSRKYISYSKLIIIKSVKILI